MPTLVTPEQRQAAKREIVWQVEQGATASVARSHSPVLMHRTTVYRVLKRVQSEGERALTDGRHGHPRSSCVGKCLPLWLSTARSTLASPARRCNALFRSVLLWQSV